MRFTLALVLSGLLGVTALPAGAIVASPRPTTKPSAAAGNLDVRVNSRRDLIRVLAGNRVDTRTTGARATAQIQGLTQAAKKLQAVSPGAEVRFSTLFGAAEIVRNPGAGALSSPAPGKAGQAIVTDFLRANAALYGLAEADLANLHWKGESVDKKSGLRMVRFEQVVHGIPVFQSDTRVTLDRNGRIIRIVGLLAPNAPANALAVSPAVTPQQALATAMKSVGIPLDPAKMSLKNASADGTRTEVVVSDPRVRGSVPSHLVYFPLGPGVLIPAWQQIAFTKGPGDWNTLVDAGSGVLLWRKNMRSHASTQEARFSVYVQGDGKTVAENPAPHSPTDVTPGAGTQFPEIVRTTVNMSSVQDLTASPNGWIDDGGNTTTGNNTDTYLDTDADDNPDTGLLDNNGRPVGNLDGGGNQRDFLGTGYAYTPAPMGGNPDAGTSPTDTQFQRGSVTQLFYDTNWYHDRLYSFGFDEAAGNFQTNNFGNGGSGGDPVLAECQDGSGTDNSNFSTPPDGMSGRMQMFLFDFPTPQRDGSLDATIVLHELTHGTSNRLIGDGNGLIWDEGGGMGEGWSDFYALSLLFGSNAFDPNGKYAVGAYATYQFVGLTDNYLYGIRRFPYSTDNSVNPLTWADVDDITYNTAGGITPSPLDVFFSGAGAMEVHNIGEIWANSLWEVRSRIIADPAGANGDVPTGNDTMLALVTDGLKMTPINPSFTDARDAILDADCAANSCANEKSIWGGFADRGLGYKATAPLGQDGIVGVGAYMGVGESFSLPYLDIAGLTIDDSMGNNNGAVDPGEPIKLTVNLFNPWRSAAMAVGSATATLTSSTAGVTITTASSTYGAISTKGSTAGTPFVFTLDRNAVCGQSLHFTITVTSSLGTKSVDFTVRVGTASGTGTPVTYTRTIAGGLAIPDDTLPGVTDAMTIADDLEVSQLEFRIDDLPHTFTGDLVVGFKAPSGYGTSLVYLRGSFLPIVNGGDGDNFVNTLITANSVNDLNQADSSSAPFTGDWLPAFNSPIWALFGIPNLGPDPIDQFAYTEGLSSQGVWKVHVADEAEADTGQLNAWSLIVTPTHFVCSAVSNGTVAVSGTKTVTGSFVPGGAITYTVVLTNSGTAAQADNPGSELTDVLPPTLTLVSAAATSGTAVATVATNTVTWDGSIPAQGGQVTITIQARINANAGGQTISNQGQISFDANVDGTNESTAQTDDPGTPASPDPTSLAVVPAITDVPTLSPLGFAALALLLAGAGFVALRRRVQQR